MKQLTPSPAFAPPDDLDAVCATEGERTLTWRSWNEQADRLASSLARRGVKEGDRVAVRSHTRLEWMVVSLAVAKLKSVIVAVNYRLSPPESLYIARDCEVTAAIVDDEDPSDLVAAWEELGLRVIVSMDTPAPGVELMADLIAEGEPEDRPSPALAPLIIYSSGTTGAPKGAPLGGLQTQVDDAVRLDYMLSVLFDMAAGGPGNTTLINLPMHHGAGPSYTQFALQTGGTVVFQRRFDAEDVLRLIERHGITHWVAVPTMLQRILKLSPEVRDRYDISSLRFLMGGAAPFSQELKSAATDLFGPVIYEIYGATETGMIAGATPDLLSRKPNATGFPFRHVDLRIVDESGNEVPTGATGEITVRTPNIISGYIGRGPLGADKISEDGFYSTGDVGHVDDEGVLFIYDRITDMIIAGGVNVYPAESEAVIATHPLVANVAVIGVPDEDHGEQPLAFVQTVPGAVLTADELYAFFEGKLAKYKWPRSFEFIEEIPTNSMGKTLKRVLRRSYVEDAKA
ncbi:class I adenylate-forming enzyme family protein [Nocardioides donggukensis]|uniref:AMP-binding protein n=1 Tax=Nocardioides donggukensis TaxID=2774019 RepID=A0A927Q0L2_9ACTN|nr:AMP-binding protein [Nocardioides donggukensis]MBD8870780.1 AMP-binding protein [Nocardioides donggukensis]